jgi:hypothetical protein
MRLCDKRYTHLLKYVNGLYVGIASKSENRFSRIRVSTPTPFSAGSKTDFATLTAHSMGPG